MGIISHATTRKQLISLIGPVIMVLLAKIGGYLAPLAGARYPLVLGRTHDGRKLDLFLIVVYTQYMSTYLLSF